MLKIVYKRHLIEIKTKKRVFRQLMCTFAKQKKKHMIDTSAFQGKTAVYYTLGCKLNFSETSTFGRMLQDMGVRTAHKGEPADICLINTCSVTDVADHKCRQAIHRMVRENPGAFVVVTGCYAQLEAEAGMVRFLSFGQYPKILWDFTFSMKVKLLKSTLVREMQP